MEAKYRHLTVKEKVAVNPARISIVGTLLEKMGPLKMYSHPIIDSGYQGRHHDSLTWTKNVPPVKVPFQKA